MSLFQPERLLGRSAEESMLLNSYFASLSMGKNDPATVMYVAYLITVYSVLYLL